jgi:uncharacterized protein
MLGNTENFQHFSSLFIDFGIKYYKNYFHKSNLIYIRHIMFLSKALTFLMVKAVRFYQRFISPYKGFRCAHAKYTGDISCSNYGLKVLKECSPLEAIDLIRHRLKACSHISQMYRPVCAHQPKVFSELTLPSKGKFNSRKSQAGFVDGCDVPVSDCNCDIPSCELPDCSAFSPDCSAIEGCGSGAADAGASAATEGCSLLSWLPYDGCLFIDCSGCDSPFWTGTQKNQSQSNRFSQNTDTNLPVTQAEYILPGFQFLLELDNDFLLYQFQGLEDGQFADFKGNYYKLHRDMVRNNVGDILNGVTLIPAEQLSEQQVKTIFEERQNNSKI